MRWYGQVGFNFVAPVDDTWHKIDLMTKIQLNYVSAVFGQLNFIRYI